MRNTLIFVVVLLLPSVVTHGADDNQRTASHSSLLMCNRGELLFSDEFDPDTVSDRWFFRGEFALRDGALVRTEIKPDESQRVFLKDPEFHNTIIQFDFKFAGETNNLRMVMGSGGHYNSVVEILRGHFQVNTPSDKEAGIVPSHIGECGFTFAPGEWYTMTVEYWGDEIVAHVDADHFVLGSHPIIDRTREYFAFQFDRPAAAIDNVRVWAATEQQEDWPDARSRLAEAQSSRAPVARDPLDRYKYAYTNLISRLTLTDEAYRQLVRRHDELKDALHGRYPDAFRTHKEINKSIQDRKQEIKKSDPEFTRMESAVHAARRAEDAWVVRQTPALKDVPKRLFESELGLARAALEIQTPAELTALVAETTRLQSALEQRFPEAFVSADSILAKQKAINQELKSDADYKRMNREVADAWQAIKRYEEDAEPNVKAIENAKDATAQ